MRTRRQGYKYSSKVAGLADQVFLTASNPNGQQIGFELLNPTDLLTIEGLTIHLYVNLTSGNSITGIAVQDDFSLPTVTNSVPIAAITKDGSNNINLTKSLTPLLNKTGRNVVVLTFDSAAAGTIYSWKLDMLYTMYGIR